MWYIHIVFGPSSLTVDNFSKILSRVGINPANISSSKPGEFKIEILNTTEDNLLTALNKSRYKNKFRIVSSKLMEHQNLKKQLEELHESALKEETILRSGKYMRKLKDLLRPSILKFVDAGVLSKQDIKACLKDLYKELG